VGAYMARKCFALDSNSDLLGDVDGGKQLV
jgi:hypothetical protein